MFKTYCGVGGALITWHFVEHGSAAAVVLSVLCFVVGFALVDGAAALARKFHHAAPTSEPRR